jgi:hypothetical protein
MVIYKMHISAGTQSAAKIIQCKDYAVRRLYCAKIVLCKACTAAGMKRKAELTCGSQQDSLAELEK